jgi:hypothetical protein
MLMGKAKRQLRTTALGLNSTTSIAVTFHRLAE